MLCRCDQLSGRVAAQSVQQLDLQEAEAIAIQNHPQIQAATELAQAAKAQVTAGAFRVLSNGQRQRHRSRCGKQQPHHGWIFEQSHHL